MDLPTWVNYVFYEDDGEQSYNYIESIPPGSLNLGALSGVVEVTNKVISKELDISEIDIELEKIHSETKKVNHLILASSYAIASGAFSLMIGSNWISVLFALLFGALVYFMVYLSNKSTYLSTVLESLIAFVVTVFAGLLSLYFSDFNVGLTILSAIIIFIPGLAITTSLEEITSRNLVSGSAKLFDAMISLFKQFFGVILGFSVLSFVLDFELLKHVSTIPRWAIFVASPLFSVSLLAIFQVRKKDMFFGVLTGVIGFLITVLFSGSGILISTFIGAIGVVVTSNLCSRITKTPKTVYLTQGIIMMVPGSKSFIGLSNVFMDATIVNTTNIYEQVAYILMGIIGGLLFGGVFKNQEVVT